MPFQIIRADIAGVQADAIVNSANPRPEVGSGTDRAIYSAAGEEQLLAERRKIGVIKPGETFATPAFALQARYILHTVGPVWEGGNHGERETLHSCYRTALALAESLHCGSIAFPLISTGVYGFPREDALSIAVEEIRRFLETRDMLVVLVVFDSRSYVLSGSLLGEIRAFIDEHDVNRQSQVEYGAAGYQASAAQWGRRRRDAGILREGLTTAANAVAGLMAPLRRKPRADRDAGESRTGKKKETADVSREEAEPREDAAWDVEEESAQAECAAPAPAFMAIAPGASLEEVLRQQRGESFQQRLFRLIDASGMDDVQVYKKANVDRKVFSRIRCKADYRPSKCTAVAFAIALELDMETMQDLLARAEIALSPSSDFDLIIMYFVTHRRYDIYEINEALFQYNQPQLGAG